MKKKLLFLFILTNLINQTGFSQIPSYVPTTDLVGWWPFSGNANDISGNGNDANNFNAVLTTDMMGNEDSAYYFNGTNAYLKVDTPSFTISPEESFSFSIWIKKEASTGVSLMIGSSTANNFITLLGGDESTSFGTNKQASSWVWCNTPHTLDNWDHYACIYDQGAMILYKNGEEAATAEFGYTNTNSSNLPLFIGKDINTSYFNGAIDDIAFWSRAITPDEVLALYNQEELTINENNITRFMVYPNPATDQIVISNGNYTTGNGMTVSIINTLGQEIYKTPINQQQLTIRLKSIASSGLYFVNVYDTSGHSIATQKLIVK